MPKLESRMLWILAGVLVAFAATLWLDGMASEIAQIVFVLGAIGLVIWAIARSLKWFLFRVGRRLAFSYFLIGVLPIPMVLLLGVLLVALFAGFYVGDLYRTGVVTVYQDIGRAADSRLAEFAARRSRPPSDEAHLYAYYKKGAGSRATPACRGAGRSGSTRPPGPTRTDCPTFVALEDGTPTLFAARANGELATLAVYTKPVDSRVSDESGVWTAMMRSDDPNKSAVVQLNILGNTIALRPIKSGAQIEEERNLFFANTESDRSGGARSSSGSSSPDRCARSIRARRSRSTSPRSSTPRRCRSIGG